MNVKLSKWGKAVGLRLPKSVVEAAGLQPGDQFEIEILGRETPTQTGSAGKTLSIGRFAGGDGSLGVG
jgi:hypothetical protein